MRTKFYLLLIALVTAIGSVWGQASNEEGVLFIVDGEPGVSSLLRYRILTPAADDGSTNGTVEVVRQNADYFTATDPFIIPATVTVEIGGDAFSYDVVAIGENAFYIVEFENSNYIAGSAGITIGENVTEIKRRAFRQSGITNIHIPANVKFIDEEAFFDCIHLEEFTIDPGTDFVVVDKILYTPDGKTLLLYPLASSTATSYTVPAGLESLGQVGFPSTIERFAVESGNNFFATDNGVLLSADKKTLIKYPEAKVDVLYEIPSTVETIAARAFLNAKFERINLSNVTEIGFSAFLFSAITGEFVVPETIKTLGNFAFRGCENLTKVVFEGRIELLETGEGMFAGCSALEGVTGFNPAKLDSFPNRFFDGCIALKEFAIPTSVSFIRANSFRDCESLESLTILSEVPPTVSNLAFNSSLAGNAADRPNMTIHVPRGSSDNFTGGVWNIFNGGNGATESFFLVLFMNEGAVYHLETYTTTTYRLTAPTTTPTREGYTFEGWYDADDKLVPFDATAYNVNSTITAKWAAIPPPPPAPTYTITINSIEGVNASSGGAVNEGRPFRFTAEAKDGYTLTAVLVNGSPASPISGTTYLIENIRDNVTVTFTVTRGSGSGSGTSTGGKVVIDGSESTIPGDFPSTGEIVLYPPAVNPGTTPSVTIDGKEVTGSWTTDEKGNPVYVIGYDDLPNGEHKLVVDGKEYTFTTDNGEGSGSDSGSTGGTKVIIDGTNPVIPGEFPSTGGIVIYPPAVDPSNPGKITIDGKEVDYTIITDADGNPIAVEINYENLPDGKHILVVGDKEYEFTTGSGATGGGKVIVDGSTPDIPGVFPPTGGIVVYPPAVDPNNPGTITIDGKEVDYTVIKDKDGNPIAVEIEYENLPGNSQIEIEKKRLPSPYEKSFYNKKNLTNEKQKILF